MTQTTGKIFDDIAKLMTNAAGAAQGVRREVDTMVRSQAERVLNDLEVVSRDEFDVVREMAVKAREENEALAARIDVLEAKIEKLVTSSTAKTPAKRPAARKAAAPKSAQKTQNTAK